MGLLAVLLLYGVAVRSVPGGWLDERVYDAILNGLPGPLRLGLAYLSRPLLPAVLTGVLILLWPLALVRGRLREAAAVLVVAVSVPATEFLRTVVLPPEGTAVDGSNGYPSTHAVGGLVALVGVALIWPRRPGPGERWVLLVLAVVIPVGNVSWYAHRPADALGSILLVASVTCLAWAICQPDLERWRGSAPGLRLTAR